VCLEYGFNLNKEQPIPVHCGLKLILALLDCMPEMSLIFNNKM
jgi:hypothetical protein